MIAIIEGKICWNEVGLTGNGSSPISPYPLGSLGDILIYTMGTNCVWRRGSLVWCHGCGS